jgi:hypothetical protein
MAAAKRRYAVAADATFLDLRMEDRHRTIPCRYQIYMHRQLEKRFLSCEQ